MQYPEYLEKEIKFPDFYRVVMDYPHHGLKKIDVTLNKTLDSVLNQVPIKPGESVAVCVGSRGIDRLPEIIQIICKKLNEIGAKPYIIPAMGSHGGATDKGQEDVLESLGITEKNGLAPVESSMSVIKIGEVLDNIPVYFSKDANEMDHSICINRIKPHTKFKGPVESGLYKMLCIGMGKHKGAEACHQAALRHGFSPVIKDAGDMIIAKTNFRFGIAVVEDKYDETMVIEAVPAEKLYQRETELLKIAKENFPKLPVNKLDALTIQEIGKNISGSGMDPNVTGRAYDLMEDDFSENMEATRLAILDLTKETAGNAIGLGNADIITEKVFQKLDYKKTLTNALTSLSFRKAFIPLRLQSEELAIKAAFLTTGIKDIKQIRAIVIKSTLHVSEFWASASLLPELQQLSEVKIIEKVKLEFDSDNNLIL